MEKEHKSKNTQDFGEIDFQGFILGLSGAALHYLGETKETQNSPKQVNLSLARQNIEIISMLVEKTRGNLTNEEEHLIQQVLLDLRLRFIEKSKQ